MFKINTPQTKEQLYYRKIFCKYYKSQEQTIPYYWLPKWYGEMTEASARVLSCYKKVQVQQQKEKVTKVQKE